MKFKKINRFLTLLAASLLLVGCGAGNSSGGGNDEGEDEIVEDLPMPTSVTQYELDDTDYDSLEEEPTKLIRIYYHRNDGNDTYSNYFPWRIWAWDAGGGNGWWREFTKYDAFGVICDIPISEIAANGVSMDKLGAVITTCSSTTATWSGTYSKDPEADILGEISPVNPGGIQRLYVKTGIATFYPTQEAVFMSSLSYARIDDNKTIRTVFSTQKSDFKLYKSRFAVSLNNEEVTDYSIQNFSISKSGGSYQASADLVFDKEFPLASEVTVSYRISSDNICKVSGIITSLYDTQDFINNYTYDGDDLGATFDNKENPTKTTFKVWSPFSSSMTLNIYNSGDYRTNEAPRKIDMTLGGKGVWSATVNEDLDGKYYTYTVKNSAGTNEVTDPYAKSAGLNGKRGMVVNFTKLNEQITGWNEDVRPDFGNQVDASVYEIHVRDMTINPNSGVDEELRGKFAGLAQKGTTYTKGDVTVTTGLNHLAELGITHVQIQPYYDFSSVDESTLDVTMGKDNYNWGYDPQNYNALEGSYSTNPTDGYSRIKEFKEMVMALHEEDINIIMDVVYNHTSSFTDSNFEKLVPNYYHRTKKSGVPYNGSGCGNEMASERYMVNKFMRESCEFWIDEYHLGGFRFDLMGLMDNQVMIDIYQDCSALYDKILIYGEPWTGGSSKLKGGNNSSNLTEQQTIQSSLNQSYFAGSKVYVGAFSDGFRNSARGDNSPSKGYVTGIVGNANGLLPGIKGLFNNNDTNVDPQQVINYVSCHDNYTLYDQIKVSNGDDNLKQRYSQAEALVFLSQGVPFMQEGEDFLRSKYDEETDTYIHNSYNYGDLVNNMDYELKLDNIDMFDYFKNLIAFRKSCDLLRLPSREAINSAFKSLNAKNGVITYEISDGDETIYVIHTNTKTSVSVEGDWEVAFTNDSVNFEIGSVLNGSINLIANTSLVLRK